MSLPVTIYLMAVPGAGQDSHTAPSSCVDFDERGITIREDATSVLAGALLYPWHRIDRIEYGRAAYQLPSEKEPLG